MRRSNRNNSSWSSLPLVPLGYILEHLSLNDALAASTICRHWRDGLLMYEGRRNVLSLHTKEFEKCAFLVRMFKKHVRVLYVYIDSGSEEEISNFMNRIMPHFFDTLKLREIIIVGPGCGHQTGHVKIDRMLIESLVSKHSRCIQKFALMNCKWDTTSIVKEDKQLHETVEFYSRGVRFDVPSASDAVLSRQNAMMVSSLQHIMLDYDQITTESLETLSHLRSFTLLSAVLCSTGRARPAVDWARAAARYRRGLSVALNLIYMPAKKLDEVMENVLVADMPLTSLKVMFCRTLHKGLVKRVVRLYKASLRELVWADAPLEGPATRVRAARSLEHDARNVNPFILLCWQCTRLTRLVVHGYWLWQYDIIGFGRLRKSLEALEISAVCGRSRGKLPAAEQASLARVLAADVGDLPDDSFQMQLNDLPELDWKPTTWRKLHPALRKRATPAQRAEYIANEASHPLGNPVRQLDQRCPN